ncbi:lipid A biosynthesis acyltransferase, partial [Oleiphilus sp. HI0078]
MAKPKKQRPLWHPSFLLTWLIVFVLFSIAHLPLLWKHSIAKKLGNLTHNKMKSRVKACRQNIDACFPELSDNEREQLVKDVFTSTSEGFIETLQSWWRDLSPYMSKVEVYGLEHLKEAEKRGGGVFLLGGHFGIFDIALPFIAAQLQKPGYMYRPNNNPVVDWMIESGRQRNVDIESFHKRQLKEMIQFMKEGGEVWYAPDQDFGKKCDLFAPFFGIDAACISTPSWIARESGAAVIHVSQYRLPNGRYEIYFSPILENFGEDNEADARAWNKL